MRFSGILLAYKPGILLKVYRGLNHKSKKCGTRRSRKKKDKNEERIKWGRMILFTDNMICMMLVHEHILI